MTSPAARDYVREALESASDSPHRASCEACDAVYPMCQQRVRADSPLCTCHVGKARFALWKNALSTPEWLRLIALEITADERSGPLAGYEAAELRAFMKAAAAMGVKL